MNTFMVCCLFRLRDWLMSGFALVDKVNIGSVFFGGMLHYTVCNLDCHDLLYGSIDGALSRT